MPKAIIILGDLACGKSTFSNILSKRYKCLCLNKDTIKEILADEIGFKNREENLKLSKLTYKLMVYTFKMNAISGNNIILEANFHEDELDELYEIISSFNYEVLTLNLTADVDILYKRFLNRAHNENRHPVHISGNLLNYDVFKEYILNNRKLNFQNPLINIDASSFNYQNEDNLKSIDKFMNK